MGKDLVGNGQQARVVCLEPMRYHPMRRKPALLGTVIGRGWIGVGHVKKIIPLWPVVFEDRFQAPALRVRSTRKIGPLTSSTGSEVFSLTPPEQIQIGLARFGRFQLIPNHADLQMRVVIIPILGILEVRNSKIAPSRLLTTCPKQPKCPIVSIGRND